MIVSQCRLIKLGLDAGLFVQTQRLWEIVL